MTAIEKFLQGKVNSSLEETQYCSLLMLSASSLGQVERLQDFTFEKVRSVLAERREMKWGKTQ